MGEGAAQDAAAAIRQELTEREAAEKRRRDAAERDAQRGPANLSHELEIGLHPGQQQQKENAELRDAVEHGLLLGGSREDRVLGVRPQGTQHRGAEQDATQQHAHDRRLADAVHGLAEHAPDHHQHDELGEKDDLGRPLRALGCESSAQAQNTECSAQAGRPDRGETQ